MATSSTVSSLTEQESSSRQSCGVVSVGMVEYLGGEKEIDATRKRYSTLGHAGRSQRLVVKDGGAEILNEKTGDDAEKENVLLEVR